MPEDEKFDRLMETMADAVSGIGDMRKLVDALSARMDSAEEKAKEGFIADRKDGDGKIEEKGDPKEVAADRKDADEKAKADAEAAEKERADAEMEEKCKADAEEAARKDAEEKAKADRKDDDGDAMADSVTLSKAQWAAMQADIANLKRGAPRIMADAERERFAFIQEEANPAFQAFGDRAPAPLEGETTLQYKRRLGNKLKGHSPKWSKVELRAFADEAALDIVATEIYADAVAAASRGVDVPAGRLREMRVQRGGHEYIDFVGTPGSWMKPFSSGVVKRG